MQMSLATMPYGFFGDHYYPQYEVRKSLPASHRVFVGGLGTKIDEKSLRAFMATQGELLECKIIADHETGISKGYGFVTFSDPHIAKSLRDRGVINMNGRSINLSEAVRKSAALADQQPADATASPENDEEDKDKDDSPREPNSSEKTTPKESNGAQAAGSVDADDMPSSSSVKPPAGEKSNSNTAGIKERKVNIANPEEAAQGATSQDPSASSQQSPTATVSSGRSYKSHASSGTFSHGHRQNRSLRYPSAFGPSTGNMQDAFQSSLLVSGAVSSMDDLLAAGYYRYPLSAGSAMSSATAASSSFAFVPFGYYPDNSGMYATYGYYPAGYDVYGNAHPAYSAVSAGGNSAATYYPAYFQSLGMLSPVASQENLSGQALSPVLSHIGTPSSTTSAELDSNEDPQSSPSAPSAITAAGSAAAMNQSAVVAATSVPSPDASSNRERASRRPNHPTMGAVAPSSLFVNATEVNNGIAAANITNSMGSPVTVSVGARNTAPYGSSSAPMQAGYYNSRPHHHSQQLQYQQQQQNQQQFYNQGQLYYQQSQRVVASNSHVTPSIGTPILSSTSSSLSSSSASSAASSTTNMGQGLNMVNMGMGMGTNMSTAAKPTTLIPAGAPVAYSGAGMAGPMVPINGVGNMAGYSHAGFAPYPSMPQNQMMPYTSHVGRSFSTTPKNGGNYKSNNARNHSNSYVTGNFNYANASSVASQHKNGTFPSPNATPASLASITGAEHLPAVGYSPSAATAVLPANESKNTAPARAFGSNYNQHLRDRPSNNVSPANSVSAATMTTSSGTDHADAVSFSSLSDGAVVGAVSKSSSDRPHDASNVTISESVQSITSGVASIQLLEVNKHAGAINRRQSNSDITPTLALDAGSTRKVV